MDLKLKDKSVIITASSQGIGKAIAKEFAKEKADVVISSRHEEKLKKTVAEIQEQTGNKNVNYVVCDITRIEDIKYLVEKTVRWYGSVHVLVNNAGGPPAGAFDSFDDDAWQRSFELNLLSFIRTIREVLPYMKKQQSGHILNIASSSIKEVLENLILSNTFRTGIVGLSKSLSVELAKYNILINTVGPGKIATERVAILDRIRAEKAGITYEEQVKKTEIAIPIGRYGKPEELAKIVAFLCSDINTYITGQSLVIDGGLVKAL